LKLQAFLLSKNRHLEPSSLEAFLASLEDGRPYWIDIEQPRQAELEKFFSPFEIHPLILETCLDVTAGYRIAPYEHALFIRMPTQLAWNDTGQSFLSIICLPWAIITIHEKPIPTLESIVRDFSTAVRFHTKSTSSILYQTIDRLTDQDMAFALDACNEVDLLEETIDKDEDSEQIDRILTLKRRIARLSSTFEDQRYCITALLTIESEVFDVKNLQVYFRDSLANIDHALRLVGHQQKRLAELHQHNLLMLQDRTNKRLKLLTIISAVFMPLTLIAGIYGMNFRYMPELKWTYGYPLVIIVMATLAIGLLWVFYRKGWFK